ncbi:MAG: NUDIX domain-containing protein [Flavobacteriales bacterium]
MNPGYPFNVRVYGLLLDATEAFVLLAEEIVNGDRVTKFPGGGLRFGEGPEDCLIREFQEEVGIRPRIGPHFYTTGFFQPSAFRPDEQVISIYYELRSPELIPPTLLIREGDPLPDQEGIERFRWKTCKEIDAEDLSLPIDREVGRRLRERFNRPNSNPH